MGGKKATRQTVMARKEAIHQRLRRNNSLPLRHSHRQAAARTAPPAPRARLPPRLLVKAMATSWNTMEMRKMSFRRPKVKSKAETSGKNTMTWAARNLGEDHMEAMLVAP